MRRLAAIGLFVAACGAVALTRSGAAANANELLEGEFPQSANECLEPGSAQPWSCVRGDHSAQLRGHWASIARNISEGGGTQPMALVRVRFELFFLLTACPVPGTTLCKAPRAIALMFHDQSS